MDNLTGLVEKMFTAEKQMLLAEKALAAEGMKTDADGTLEASSGGEVQQ